MATSTLVTFRTNLAANITTQLASDAVTGVQVFEYPPGDEAPKTDMVYIHQITTTQTRLVYGGPRSESLDAELVVFTQAPGAGDTIAKAVETRAVLIAASIETTLRDDPDVGTGVWDAEYAGHNSEPGVTPEGRFTELTATVTAESHI